MDDEMTKNIQVTYDRVADEYVRRIYGELKHKLLDRQLLSQFAARVHGLGAICDLGCGPGHVTRYLHECEAQVIGIDLSAEMIERARRLSPGIEFQQDASGRRCGAFFDQDVCSCWPFVSDMKSFIWTN